MDRKLVVVVYALVAAAAFLVTRALGLSGPIWPAGGDASSTPAWTVPADPLVDPVAGMRRAPMLRVSPSRLGDILTDGDGYTLYRFDQGSHPADPQQTDPRVDPLPDRRLAQCDPATPAGWSPVPYSPNTAHPGIDGHLLGFLDRADGSRQLTIGGCPIYRYLEDHTPGQTNGRGQAGLWFAVTPTGHNANRPL
jgi:predicted lipoprotein with Yx(FWY)xxD motif